MNSPHREAAAKAAEQAFEAQEAPKNMGYAVRAALDAARPHERAAFREELLSDKAVEAAARATRPFWGAYKPGERLRALEETRQALRAAFDAIGEKPPCTCGHSHADHNHKRLGSPCRCCEDSECAGYEADAIGGDHGA